MFRLITGAVAALALVGCGSERAARPERQQPAERPARGPEPASPDAARPPSGGQEPVRLTVAASGDLLIHSPIFQRAAVLAGGRGYDFRPMLRELRPIIRGADLALCHVETPMSPAAPAGYPRFNTPPALARAIRATGWDACSTASNHSVDRGQPGVDATLRAMSRAGVQATGTARSRAGGRRILVMRARGVRIAFLSYTTSTNGLPVPHEWSVNLAEPGRIVADARRARRQGADAVIVNMHWGTEYRHGPDPQQQRLARRLARSPHITAVVGQHAHVVQPVRRVAGTWVVYGTGNLLSNQTAACCPSASQDGVIALLRLSVRDGEARTDRVDYVPTWVRHPDFVVLPVARALRRGQADRGALRASWQRTVGVVGRRPGLSPLPRRLARSSAPAR